MPAACAWRRQRFGPVSGPGPRSGAEDWRAVLSVSLNLNPCQRSQAASAAARCPQAEPHRRLNPFADRLRVCARSRVHKAVWSGGKCGKWREPYRAAHPIQRSCCGACCGERSNAPGGLLPGLGAFDCAGQRWSQRAATLLGYAVGLKPGLRCVTEEKGEVRWERNRRCVGEEVKTGSNSQRTTYSRLPLQ